MNKKRLMKEQCYLEALENSVVSVEMIINRLRQIEDKMGIFDKSILLHDQTETILDLELHLASLCILLRKMSENMFIVVSDALRADMNSIIHSNRFEYDKGKIVVYSQKGREEVNLDELLKFCHCILSNDKVCI